MYVKFVLLYVFYSGNGGEWQRKAQNNGEEGRTSTTACQPRTARPASVVHKSDWEVDKSLSAF